jgi:hypothetical protein
MHENTCWQADGAGTGDLSDVKAIQQAVLAAMPIAAFTQHSCQKQQDRSGCSG